MRRTFNTALSLMERSDDFRFNQSTAHYYAQMEEEDPELLDRIKKKVADGKWETVGGMPWPGDPSSGSRHSGWRRP